MTAFGKVWRSTSKWVKRGIKREVQTWMLLDLGRRPWVTAGRPVAYLRLAIKKLQRDAVTRFRRAQFASPLARSSTMINFSPNLLYRLPMPSVRLIRELVGARSLSNDNPVNAQ
jgi:hypothetical protein